MRVPSVRSPALFEGPQVSLVRELKLLTMYQGRAVSELTRPLSALVITVIYLVIAGVWVIYSEFEFRGMVKAPPLAHLLNHAVFVTVSAVSLFGLINYHVRRIRESAAAEQESAATAQAYLTYASEGIIVVDSDGRITQVNPKGESFFGYRQDELVGSPIEILIPERLRQMHTTHRANYFQAPRSRPMGLGLDLAGRRKDGREFPIEVRLTFVQTKDGGSVICTVADITERRLLEREARRTEMLSALGQVAAGIAHELNNPLTIVSSRVELMLAATEYELSPEVREDLGVVHRNAQRASRIAAELLALARQRPSARKPVNINHLVHETLLLFREPMLRDGIEITTSLDSTLKPVMGDATELGQVLVNLVMNAHDAMAGGGSLRIETSAEPDKPGFVRLSVSDNGCGIPAEAMPRLFEAFYTTKATGTGLGLWLSRRAIRDHRGTIAAHSEPGKGTTIVIMLPTIDGISTI